MKIITMAHITLNRPGSLGGGGFPSGFGDGSPKERSETVVLESDEPGDILKAVKKLAIEHGEHEERLSVLRSVSRPYGTPDGTICFAERPQPYGGRQLGKDYAVCKVFPALEVNGRYFRLDEVILQPSF